MKQSRSIRDRRQKLAFKDSLLLDLGTLALMDPLSLYDPVKKYFVRHGPQKIVSASLSDANPDKIVLALQRPIDNSDVVDGKLVPVSMEKITNRGGKRLVRLSVSYESAVALQKLLKPVLKEAKRQQRRKRFRGNLMKTVISHSLYVKQLTSSN